MQRNNLIRRHRTTDAVKNNILSPVDSKLRGIRKHMVKHEQQALI